MFKLFKLRREYVKSLENLVEKDRDYIDSLRNLINQIEIHSKKLIKSQEKLIEKQKEIIATQKQIIENNNVLKKIEELKNAKSI